MSVLSYPKPLDAAPKSNAPKRVTVLGATGSIGESTLDLVGRKQADYEVIALTGGKNVARLAALARTHRAKRAVIADHTRYAELRDALSGSGIEVASGSDAVAEAASLPADWVMGAIVGIEIPISKLFGKWKASQNRPAADRAGIVEALGTTAEADSLAMARLIKERSSP